MFAATREVRIERVVLEDHGDVAVLRSRVRDVAAADPDAALVDVLETGEHAQRGRLPRARRADEHHELAVLDVEVESVDSRDVAARDRPASPARSGRQPSPSLLALSPSSSSESTAAASSSRARAPRLLIGAERVEPEERRAHDRRRRRRGEPRSARPSPRQARPRSRRAAARLPRACSPPPSSTSTGSRREVEAGDRDAGERDDLGRRAARTISAATRSSAASAKTTGASSISRRWAIRPRRGSPRRARAASPVRSAPARRARGSSSGRVRPRFVPRPRAPRCRRRSHRPSRR